MYFPSVNQTALITKLIFTGCFEKKKLEYLTILDLYCYSIIPGLFWNYLPFWAFYGFAFLTLGCWTFHLNEVRSCTEFVHPCLADFKWVKTQPLSLNIYMSLVAKTNVGAFAQWFPYAKFKCCGQMCSSVFWLPLSDHAVPGKQLWWLVWSDPCRPHRRVGMILRSWLQFSPAHIIACI